MRRFRELLVILDGLFNKRRKDRELDHEIESHLPVYFREIFHQACFGDVRH